MLKFVFALFNLQGTEAFAAAVISARCELFKFTTPSLLCQELFRFFSKFFDAAAPRSRTYPFITRYVKMPLPVPCAGNGSILRQISLDFGII